MGRRSIEGSVARHAGTRLEAVPQARSSHERPGSPLQCAFIICQRLEPSARSRNRRLRGALCQDDDAQGS